MPRDSNGTYTLPAGNPVVTLTTIASSWANNTMSDIATALTGSLSRAGDGGMTAPLELADGSAGAPGLSWGTETTAGLYRAGAGDFRYSVASTAVWQTVAGAFRVVAGSAATPSLSFITDTNTGVYLAGTDTIGFTGNGAAIATLAPTQFLTVDGTVLLPGVSFITDPNSGVYRISADLIGLAANGAISAQWGTQGFGIIAGAAATPSLYVIGDTNTGFYSVGADSIGASTGGTLRFTINTAAITSTLPVVHPLGTSGAPSITFVSDLNTGIYSPSADNIAFVGAATQMLQLNANGAYHNDGSAGTPSISFLNDQDTGFYRIAANDLGFALGGSGFPVGYRSMPRNLQSAAYVFVATDNGKVVDANSAGNFTVNDAVFAAGDSFILLNTTGSNCTIVQGTGVTMSLIGVAATTGNRTLASVGWAFVYCRAANNFVVGGINLT